MIQLRVMFTEKEERKDAMRIAKKIASALSKRYSVTISKKVYKNRKNNGGRIYMVVVPRS